MRVLAVTCYTGNEELVKMTEDCCKQLLECVSRVDSLSISATKQGAVRAARYTSFTEDRPENVGFAFGMNRAVEAGLSLLDEWDYVLCFNNDLQFPHKNWLRHLIDIAEQTMQVVVPATDNAAIRTQQSPRSLPSKPVQESSAYCWLIPFAWCQFLKETYGFWLFDEDFAPAYGEDNWTSFLLSKEFGPKVFRYVPRSFVKHLRHRTSRAVVHDRKATSRVLVDKLKTELQDPKLRGDLKLWAKRYIQILSGRL